MPISPESDDLDLPPLDGEDDQPGATDEDDDELDASDDGGDALDDSTAEDASFEDTVTEGAEGGWLADSEGDPSVDVGAFDVGLGDEGKILEDDEPDNRPVEEDASVAEEHVTADGGEEGPLGDDEELREEDLPALDADDDGDVEDAALFDGALLAGDEELRWDDRAWARVDEASEPASDDGEDSGMLAVPGEDAKLGARDATWRRLEETGRLTAATLVPGDGVVVAMDVADHPVLVRILQDGVARIIAEIEIPAADDDHPAVRVTHLRWDAARGAVVASGPFGSQAFRPA